MSGHQALDSSRVDIPRALIEKYSGQGPRYTSYPTAVEFRDSFTEREWQEAISHWHAEGRRRVALYTHVPFCRSLCYFCACHKVITEDRTAVDPFLSAVTHELSLYAKALGGKDLTLCGIHWGGGSPNYLSPTEMQQLFSATKTAFPTCEESAEISLEVDPRTTTEDQLVVAKQLGFNRVSLGVQDFAAHVQEAINRVQSFEQTWQLVKRSRELGFAGVNLDLIYGLPGQELASFGKTLEQVISIHPDRIALYGYAHVTWIKKVQKALERHPLPTPSTRIELFRRAVTELTAAGYVYIGMDHFALPGDSLTCALRDGTLTRNFMGYTTEHGDGTLGVGPSAISGIGIAYAQNEKELSRYQQLLSTSVDAQLPIIRGLRLSAEDQLRADIISQILCQGSVDYAAVGAKWQVDFRDYFAAEIQQLSAFEADGLLEMSSERMQLTPLGRYFMRNIAMIFDAYLNTHVTSGRKVFSQTV